MDKRCVFSPNGPPAVGPYSHAVAAGNMLFVSGQLGLNPDGSGLCAGGIEEESRQALSNLRAVLTDAGSGLEHVVKMTVYLSNMDDFAKFNAVYKDFFSSEFPARTCIQAGGLPLGANVEVEAIALLP